MSQEQKDKIGLANKAKKHSEEQNRNHSINMTGIKHKKKRSKDYNKGMRWWHKGDVIKRSKDQPEEFLRGMRSK